MGEKSSKMGNVMLNDFKENNRKLRMFVSGWGAEGSSRGCANEGRTWIYVWNVAKQLIIALIFLEVSLINRTGQDFAFIFQHKQHPVASGHWSQSDPGGRAALTALILTHKSMELSRVGKDLEVKPSTRAGCGDLPSINHFIASALQSSGSSQTLPTPRIPWEDSALAVLTEAGEEDVICSSLLICIISIINLFVFGANDFWGAGEQGGVFDPNLRAGAVWGARKGKATTSKSSLLGTIHSSWDPDPSCCFPVPHPNQISLPLQGAQAAGARLECFACVIVVLAFSRVNTCSGYYFFSILFGFILFFMLFKMSCMD